MKGYKVTNGLRLKTVGVACKTLHDLETKARQKLDFHGKAVIALDDGTLVQDEEYFQCLPAQTVFIFYKPDEPVLTPVDLILDTLKRVNSTYLDVGAESARILQEKASELSSLFNNVVQRPVGNTAKDDPDWFDGLETNAKTKEDFMSKKAQDRIRGYFYKFQEDVRKSMIYKTSPVHRVALSNCLEKFKTRLGENFYFGCYFDRRFAGKDCTDCGSRGKKPKLRISKIEDEALQSSYCNRDGLFTCDGLWNLNRCLYNIEHSINPYMNRESRVIFSTWNLDHRIEKSRTVLPALLSAVEKSTSTINPDYFFRLLFTRINLKLVHIVCHDKTSHDVACDEKLMFLPC